MNHQAIDAGNIAERYVTGRLSPEEAASFEEHYLDCPSCCARVEAAERLQRGLRRLAEEAAVGAPGDSRSTFWSRSPRLALAAAALIAVALVPAWLELGEIRRLRSDLDATREALARRPAENGSAERLTAVEGELQRTRRDLAAEAAKREALTREISTDRQPQANLPVVPLTPVRGGLGDGPVRTLELPEKPGWIALWVEPGDADFPAYRATLRTGKDAVVFQASRLTLNDLGALLVTVHSTSLSPGDYRLDLDGLPVKGAPVPVGRFPLRITR
jgi:Putative zinc-finger